MFDVKSLHKLLQLIGQFVFIPLLFVGPFLYQGAWLHWLIAWYFWSLFVFMFNEMGVHLSLVHNSFKMRKWLDRFCGFTFTTFCLLSPIGFGLVHWAHHRYADTEKDPHAPKYKGWRSYLYTDSKIPEGDDMKRAFIYLKRFITDPVQTSYMNNLHLWVLLYPSIVCLVAYILGMNIFLALYFAWVMPCGIWISKLIFGIWAHRNGQAEDSLLFSPLNGFFEHKHKQHHINQKEYRFSVFHKICGKILQY